MRKRPVSTPLAVLFLLACAPKASQAEGDPASAATVAPAAAPTKSDFEWTGEVAKVEVSTVVGDVRVVAASGNQVRIRASKSGKDAAEVTIDVDVKGDRVSVTPQYPKRNHSDARVDFVVEVPGGIAVDAQTVNGQLTADGVTAAVALQTVDGSISTSNCGDVRGSTVNGRVQVQLPQRGGKRVDLEAVNGQLELRMAAGTGARVQASTVSGKIRSDFPLAHTDEVVGSHASGTLGDGSTKVDLSTVNGGIAIAKS
jgi:DUF4097 and DUF4098 domain-containing protein YvlB